MKFMPMFQWLPWEVYLVSAIILGAILLMLILRKKMRRVRNFRRVVIVALILLLCLRPVIKTQNDATDFNTTNIFFAIDLTNSMNEKDYMGNSRARVEMAKLDMQEFVKKYPGASFSLIAVDKEAHTVLPLTDNTAAMEECIVALSAKSSEDEKSLEKLIEYTALRVEAAEKRNAERQNYLFVFGDNANVEDVTGMSRKNLSGGMVIVYDKNENADRFRDFSATLGLQNVARNNAYRMAGNIKEQNEALTEKMRENENIEYVESYWIIALALLALMIWGYADVLERFLMERKVEYD